MSNIPDKEMQLKLEVNKHLVGEHMKKRTTKLMDDALMQRYMDLAAKLDPTIKTKGWYLSTGF